MTSAWGGQGITPYKPNLEAYPVPERKCNEKTPSSKSLFIKEMPHFCGISA